MAKEKAKEFPSERFECPECKSIRVKTRSGAVCPNGHGRIYPGITKVMITKYLKAKDEHEWLCGLPVCVDRGRGVILIGKQTFRAIDRRVTKKNSNRLWPLGTVIAVPEGKTIAMALCPVDKENPRSQKPRSAAQKPRKRD